MTRVSLCTISVFKRYYTMLYKFLYTWAEASLEGIIASADLHVATDHSSTAQVHVVTCICTGTYGYI